MGNHLMGFEGQLFVGGAGSTATNLLENCRDIAISRGVTRGNTTSRGDSSAPPIETADVASRKVGIEFTMLNDKTDAHLETLRQAAAGGTAVALRGKDYSAGKGPDGDYTLEMSEPWNLNGEQVITFTGEPTKGYGRVPVSYT